jgi:hypothetical protein
LVLVAPWPAMGCCMGAGADDDGERCDGGCGPVWFIGESTWACGGGESEVAEDAPTEAADEAPEGTDGAVGGIVVVCPPMSLVVEYLLSAAICAANVASIVGGGDVRARTVSAPLGN